MNKRFVIILIGLVVVFGGLLLFNKRDTGTTKDGNGNENVQPTEHKIGEGTTGVTLTEYGDFECPACRQYYPVVQQVKNEYGDEITFQFRHFPLTQIHQYALLAARAAEAAGMQGKFFEMHDLLYENQETWKASSNPSQVFEDYASRLALNVDKFRKDMKSERVNDLVQADLAEANKKDYSSTPTFEINGEKIENPRNLEGFKKVIDEAIKKASGNPE